MEHFIFTNISWPIVDGHASNNSSWMPNKVCVNGSSNCTNAEDDVPAWEHAMSIIMAICYFLICVVGLVGNGLVIYVVLRYAKMKTVTNMYIVNLATADVLFLVGLPFLITTMLLKYWTFGYAMCKLFFVSTSINWFTSVFTLTVMSADRYLAVCYPVESVRFRTPNVSRMVCLTVWSLSVFVILPVILYANTVPNYKVIGKDSCTIMWPPGQVIPPDKAFTWYTLLLSFAIPVPLISVFYILVILRLRTVGPVKKSKEKKKSRKKVTRMVLTVILVYVVCWLPYWIHQVDLTLSPPKEMPPPWKIMLFNGITVLSYANSMLNPVLYAFLSDNFRKSFAKAFRCTSAVEANRSLYAETSSFPRFNNHNERKYSREVTTYTETFEFTTGGSSSRVVLRSDEDKVDATSALCNGDDLENAEL